MARLVEVMGVNHAPNLPARLRSDDTDALVQQARLKFGQMRAKLAAARPDVLVVLGNDHLNQWFMDNMPAFIVGKAPTASGPFKHEIENWGMPRYEVPVNTEVAKTIVQAGFRHRVDFAFSDECDIDHAFTVPLALIRPEQDIPIVPVYANIIAPPLAPCERFYQVGEAIGAIIREDLPAELRVAVLASGHLPSVEVGGPRMLKRSAVDRAEATAFDMHMVDLMSKGDVDAIIAEATVDRLLEAGNVGTGFMMFVMAAGVAGGRAPSQADGIPFDVTNLPFFTWDLYQESEA